MFWLLKVSAGKKDDFTDEQLVEYCKKILASWEESNVMAQEDDFFEKEYPAFLRAEKKRLFHKWIFEGKLPPQGKRDLPF